MTCVTLQEQVSGVRLHSVHFSGGCVMRNMLWLPAFILRRNLWFWLTTMNQVFSTIRNVSWRWRERFDPAYAHLYVEGTEGDSNCEGDASRKQTFFYYSSSGFLRFSLMFLFLMFATTSLIASFYMGQHLAKKDCQSSYFHLDPIWGKSKSWFHTSSTFYWAEEDNVK